MCETDLSEFVDEYKKQHCGSKSDLIDGLACCPFCHAQPVEKKEGMWIRIECENEMCSINPKTRWSQKRSKAVITWNKRAG